MGSLFRVTVYAPDQQTADEAFAAAFQRAAELDNTLSDYKPDSELMRVCREAWQRPVRVSEDLFAVLSASQKLAQETGGAFDVTLAPVIRLWREARKAKRLPTPDEIATAKALTGYRKLKLDANVRTVFLAQRGMLLDVGGIAKGYAAEEALRVLRDRGITSALVAASGDLAIGDAPPGTQGWRVGIDLGDGPQPGFARVLLLHNASVSTSGDTEQFLELDGARYSHIVDPKTGVGLTNRIEVAVVAPHGLIADGLDTTASVLGYGNGFAFLKRHHVAAIMLQHHASGSRIRATRQFDKLPAAH
jgi:thiamine biosynthesis lipoprotein